MITEGYISGIGTLIDLFFSLIIAIRLYKPAKEDDFRYDSFRGSFFWTFVFFSLFFAFMSMNLFVDDVKFVGLWGYTFGHIFLYLVFAVNIFVPFSVISESKIFPKTYAILTLISGAVVTYLNWIAYETEETLPVFDNGATIWNPPLVVRIYIPIMSMLTWMVFGFLFFMYHAFNTKETWLRKRSLLIGIGFLIVSIGGPLHDQPFAGFMILIADVVTSFGIFILSLGIFTRKPSE